MMTFRFLAIGIACFLAYLDSGYCTGPTSQVGPVQVAVGLSRFHVLLALPGLYLRVFLVIVKPRQWKQPLLHGNTALMNDNIYTKFFNLPTYITPDKGENRHSSFLQKV